jgi:hypothetical protein
VHSAVDSRLWYHLPEYWYCAQRRNSLIGSYKYMIFLVEYLGMFVAVTCCRLYGLTTQVRQASIARGFFGSVERRAKSIAVLCLRCFTAVGSVLTTPHPPCLDWKRPARALHGRLGTTGTTTGTRSPSLECQRNKRQQSIDTSLLCCCVVQQTHRNDGSKRLSE